MCEKCQSSRGICRRLRRLKVKCGTQRRGRAYVRTFPTFITFYIDAIIPWERFHWVSSCEWVSERTGFLSAQCSVIQFSTQWGCTTVSWSVSSLSSSFFGGNNISDSFGLWNFWLLLLPLLLLPFSLKNIKISKDFQFVLIDFLNFKSMNFERRWKRAQDDDKLPLFKGKKFL